MKTKEEIELLRADALSGDSGAQNDLGCAYSSGDGVTKDLKEASKWFELSAKKGNKYGQYNLARYYHFGWGVKKNIRSAVEWYEKAALNGYGKAAIALGEIYEKGETYENIYEQFTEYDILSRAISRAIYAKEQYEEAFFWYNVAEHHYNSGGYDIKSRYNLARCYELGRGTLKNFYKACELYRGCGKMQEAQEGLKKIEESYNPNLDSRLVSLDILGNNPFRVLGVYSNASEREIRANKNRIEVMAKVGKTPSFDNDRLIPCCISDNIATCQASIEFKNTFNYNTQLNEKSLQSWIKLAETNPSWHVLPNRSVSNVEDAIYRLSSDKERIKYALFWFHNFYPADKELLDLLFDHKLEIAGITSYEENNYSTHINKAVICWYLRYDSLAINEIIELIEDDRCRMEFISAVTSGRLQLTKDELFAIFLDALFDFPQAELSIYDITEKHINKKLFIGFESYYYKKLFNTIASPLEELLHIAESQDYEDLNKCRLTYDEAAKKAKITIRQLQLFVGEQYYRFNPFCNDVAQKFLQFGIHYNNDNTSDWDAPYTALRYARLAENIATDEALRERCMKNVAIFENNNNIALSEKACECIDKKFNEIEGDSTTLSQVEEVFGIFFKLLGVIELHAGKESDIYKIESNGIVNKLLNIVIVNYNKKRDSVSANYAEKILRKMKGMAMTIETRKRLDKNIQILSNSYKSNLEEGGWERIKINTHDKTHNLSNNGISIQAPQNVYLGDNFEVRFTIKGRIDKIDTPHISNLTYVEGPIKSRIATTSIDSGSVVIENSTVFTFTYRAEIEGIAVIDGISCDNNGKRLVSNKITIKVQKGIQHHSPKTLSQEEQASREKSEEELWKACSHAGTYEIYLQQLPNGEHRLEAMQRIKAKAERRFWRWAVAICCILIVASLLIIKI